MCKDRLSPLQRIELQAEQILGPTEQIEETVASVEPPWWMPPRTTIATTAKGATVYHRVHQESMGDIEHLLFYSDGSDNKGRVSASSWCPKLKTSKGADLLDPGPHWNTRKRESRYHCETSRRLESQRSDGAESASVQVGAPTALFVQKNSQRNDLPQMERGMENTVNRPPVQSPLWK